MHKGLRQLECLPEEERNFYDCVLLRLWEMHKQFWRLRLTETEVWELYVRLLKEGDEEHNSDAGFFAAQMRMELGQRIKELGIEWFARGIHWMMLQYAEPDARELLPCKANKSYGKLIRLLTRKGNAVG